MTAHAQRTGESSRLKAVWKEIRDRKVLKVGLVYAVMAWGVLQVGELLFEALQVPEGALTLLVILVLLGFPMALVLAWAYEITPAGVRRDVVFELHPEFQRAAGLPEPLFSESGNPACLAILPFQDMTRRRDDGYLCEGIAEEIQSELCGIEVVDVVSRAFAAPYGGKNIDMKKVSEELHVCAVLGGSVRRCNGETRVSVQLVNSLNGVDIWSKTYSFHDTDDFTIEQEVARAVCESLRSSLAAALGGNDSVGQDTGRAH